MIVSLAVEGDMPEVLALRHEVFVVGQGVPVELEQDERDVECDHAVARRDRVVVGTGRLLPEGVIGRMAVAESERGTGVGALVLAFLEQRARERGMPSVALHAQVHAAGFYNRAGYAPYGDSYLEAGIEHVSMRKTLSEELHDQL
jgi:predicted GNAT family N-acyltransferase